MCLLIAWDWKRLDRLGQKLLRNKGNRTCLNGEKKRKRGWARTESAAEAAPAKLGMRWWTGRGFRAMSSASMRSQIRFRILHFHALGSPPPSSDEAAAEAMAARASASRRTLSASNVAGSKEEEPSTLPAPQGWRRLEKAAEKEKERWRAVEVFGGGFRAPARRRVAVEGQGRSWRKRSITWGTGASELALDSLESRLSWVVSPDHGRTSLMSDTYLIPDTLCPTFIV